MDLFDVVFLGIVITAGTLFLTWVAIVVLSLFGIINMPDDMNDEIIGDRSDKTRF